MSDTAPWESQPIPSETRDKGLMATLFDASFDRFITPTIVAISYWFWIVLIGLGTLIVLVVSVLQTETILVAVFVVPVAFLLLILVRVVFEATMLFFSMAADLKALRQQQAD